MRKLLLLAIIPTSALTAQVQTTTGAGNFFNPLLWDCFCVPANGDSLVINHAMQLTASVYYDAGQIKINSSGSLTEDGMDRDVMVDGGSLINHGTFDCYRLYIANGSFLNTGTSVYFDSLWNQAIIENTGTISAYDFLNDQTGEFTNYTSANLVITNNFNNQGLVNNTGGIEVSNDFSNCNIQTSNATFNNDGTFCITGDFTNCLSDTLAGNGNYFIEGSSSNFGYFADGFVFNTNSGNLSLNTGTIESTVDFGMANCNLGLTNENVSQLTIYPNPANNQIYISESGISYRIIDLNGKQILSGISTSTAIDISEFTTGIYCVELTDENGIQSTHKLIKH